MSAYYNEIDGEMADWLRELIGAGLIPAGDVDERSIKDVQAADLDGYDQCHFFAGLGGWPLALRLAGWPDDRPVWTGSCPCQPYSSAGKRQGDDDERNLWPDFYRLIRKRRPDAVVGEQVASAIRHGWLDGISDDLEAEDYAVGSIVLPACSLGAPHIRQRLWWCGRLQQPQGDGRQQRRAEPGGRGAAGGRGPGGVSDNINGGLEDGRAEGDGENRDGHSKRGAYSRDVPETAELFPTGGLPGGDGDGRRVDEPGRRQDQRAAAGRRGETGGPHDATGAGRQGVDAELLPTGQEERRLAGRPVADGRTRHAALPEVARFGPQPLDLPGQADGAGPWSDYRLVWYRDGKTRRVEPEPVGLADGLRVALEALRAGGLAEAEAAEIMTTWPLVTTKRFPGRRMLLKGWGNAIVPQVAAEFIRAAFGEDES